MGLKPIAEVLDNQKKVDEERRLLAEARRLETEIAIKEFHRKEVKKLIDETIPGLIEKAVSKGQTKISVPPEQEVYGGFYSPDSEQAATVIKALTEAGYAAKVVTKKIPNSHFVPTADGYDIVEDFGTHPFHHLEVSWELVSE